MVSTKSPAERYSAILKWCDTRDIAHRAFAFFAPCVPSIEAHEARIRYVLRSRNPRLTEEDERWLQPMETVIAAVDKIKQVAA